MRGDGISVVEAARVVTGDEGAWVRSIAESAQRASPLFENCFCFLYDAREPTHVRMHGGAAVGDPGALELIARTNAVASPELIVEAYLSRPIDTLSTLLGTDYEASPVIELLKEAGYEDVLGVVGGDPTGFGCLLGSLLPKRMRVNRETRHQWSRIAAHIATTFRVRRELRGGLLADPDAVLSPNGRVEHASADAAPQRARSALRHAARQAERARGALRREDVGQAIEIWEAMVVGRWSLVDTFDSDGRRFFVARNAEPLRDTPSELTQRERQVAALAALGHPQKLIGYELGLAPSTINMHLSRALTKLGLETRTELAGYFLDASVSPTPPPAESS